MPRKVLPPKVLRGRKLRFCITILKKLFPAFNASSTFFWIHSILYWAISTIWWFCDCLGNTIYSVNVISNNYEGVDIATQYQGWQPTYMIRILLKPTHIIIIYVRAVVHKNLELLICNHLLVFCSLDSVVKLSQA